MNNEKKCKNNEKNKKYGTQNEEIEDNEKKCKCK